MNLLEITNLKNETVLYHVSTLCKKTDEMKIDFLTTHKHNNNKLIPLGIKKRKVGNIFYFELELAPRKLPSNQTIPLDVCDIC